MGQTCHGPTPTLKLQALAQFTLCDLVMPHLPSGGLKVGS